MNNDEDLSWSAQDFLRMYRELTDQDEIDKHKRKAQLDKRREERILDTGCSLAEAGRNA